MTGSTNQFIHFEPTNTLSKIHPKNYNNSPPISKSWIRAWSSSVRKHYDNDRAGAVPEDLLSCFKVLKKCICLVNEMLYIKHLTPSLNVQTDSIRAKVFV